jgi:hypothetical protein
MEVLLVSAAGALRLLAADIAEFISPWLAPRAKRHALPRVTGCAQVSRTAIALIRKEA